MEKYRFIYFTGEASKAYPNNPKGTREFHAVAVVFRPNADYEYDEKLDYQFETQEQVNEIKSLTIQGINTTRWE